MTVKEYVTEIAPDKMPFNPRKEMDHDGVMVCFHGRYDLGDKHGFSVPGDFSDFMRDNPSLIYLPLYLYDHSGITISTSPFSCSWDSGQVGYIYGDPKDGVTEDSLRSEVSEYDMYLTGDVWCIVIKDKDGDVVDSLSGVYGYDYAVKGAEEMTELMQGPPRLYKDSCCHTDEQYLGRAVSYSFSTYADLKETQRGHIDPRYYVDVYLLVDDSACHDSHSLCIRHSDEPSDYISTNLRSLLCTYEGESYANAVYRRRIFALAVKHLGLDYLYDERDLYNWYKDDDTGEWYIYA